VGHEDAFPRPRLSARCRFSQRTFGGRGATGETRRKRSSETDIGQLIQGVDWLGGGWRYNFLAHRQAQAREIQLAMPGVERLMR
jgi:hypothetical protein